MFVLVGHGGQVDHPAEVEPLYHPLALLPDRCLTTKPVQPVDEGLTVGALANKRPRGALRRDMRERSHAPVRAQEPVYPEVEQERYEQNDEEDDGRRERVVLAVVGMLEGTVGLFWREHVSPGADHWREGDGEGDDPDEDCGQDVGPAVRPSSVGPGVEQGDVPVHGHCQ